MSVVIHAPFVRRIEICGGHRRYTLGCIEVSRQRPRELAADAGKSMS